MIVSRALRIVLPALFLTHMVSGQAVAGRNEIYIRGQQQQVYLIPAKGTRQAQRLLFFPGDGGWHGFAVRMAETMASWGYDVYGVDTRRYLMSQSESTAITDKDIAGDLRQFAEFAQAGTRARVGLVGWSEGAGLCMVAAAAPENRAWTGGVVAIGATEKNVRILKWLDLLAELRKIAPKEPVFASSNYAGKITPTRLAIIQSTNDEYVSQEESRKIFGQAREPRKLIWVDAANHRFEDKREEFYEKLRSALRWIGEESR